MKKRILRSSVGLIVIASFALPSCEFLEDCGTCTLIVEVDGVVDEDQTGIPLPFCGDALIEKQNSSPTVVGSTVSYWDCI
ncbi:MAG: hypothetical protein PF450_01530 [Bacteroidales bacterium]|jgi:hypothetical protein|nr:hypothetical protein [Bacteroidales bacterium]